MRTTFVNKKRYHTFITRCKESGVHGEVVLLWDGHEEDKTIHSSKVDRGYTDFSKEFQLKEATKVNYLEWNFEKPKNKAFRSTPKNAPKFTPKKLLSCIRYRIVFKQKSGF